jgi:hypothetical protein
MLASAIWSMIGEYTFTAGITVADATVPAVVRPTLWTRWYFTLGSIETIVTMTALLIAVAIIQTFHWTYFSHAVRSSESACAHTMTVIYTDAIVPAKVPITFRTRRNFTCPSRKSICTIALPTITRPEATTVWLTDFF